MKQIPALILAGAVSFIAALPAAAVLPGNHASSGWNVMNCNGHTHIIYAPTWLLPNGRMANVMIMDRDHDNYSPLKLTVNSITETAGGSCGNSSDFSFPTAAATNPIGGTVTTVVKVRAAQCDGILRTYDINVTCEHDGKNKTGGVDPAFGTLDLIVTVGGKRPAAKQPVNPAE